MLAVFSLRLALGMVACLLLLPVAQVNPRFYRTHFLTALGLVALAAVTFTADAGVWLWVALIAAGALAFVGSVVWHVEGAPGGRAVMLLTLAALVAGLLQASAATRPRPAAWLLADELTSSALLGAAMTAMLMGHSYLIAPSMSLTPLLRLLGALAVCTFLRMAVAGGALWSWTGEPGAASLEAEASLWLPVRWLVGFLGPLGLGWMAWEAARIRSTQSATGILYVVVILCFLGELTGQLLGSKTGALV